jgi:hypothetical protein
MTYVAVVLVTMLLAFGVLERQHGIFACPASYEGGWYLSECNATDYGEFDHGAFWLGLVKRASEHAAAADVLGIGNSRLLFGFSTPSTEKWFGDRGVSFYLLGFSYWETVQFTGPLLKKLHPRAKAYVINVDGFFLDTPSLPGNQVMNDAGAWHRTLVKAAWQPLHRALCSNIPKLCKDTTATYRRIDTGEFRFAGHTWTAGEVPVVVKDVDLEAVAKAQAIAEPFLASLPVDKSCIVLTYVWTTQNERAGAEELARRLGLTFVSPQVQGLTTIDGSHLDAPSAERFSHAFFEEAAPYLNRCVGAGAGSQTASNSN